ncbi:hypothetical protein GCM10023085_57420 [Actinomadura viridis]|uniref:Uncharacterized protein n=1 Tax=Actinomadura viridis TaxID=58110 RepID=A0A931DEC4_9ACTN|nr:hypothetical protein [Actinomadura viridis]MBG6086011.1 hypothetical protein [Actinomadura viridis]
MPGTVRLAVSLMLIIAVVQIAGVSLGFMAADEMRAELEAAYSADEYVGADDVNAKVRESLIGGIVLTGLLSALWSWMAVKYRSGRRWARITGTILFGLFTFLWVLWLGVFNGEPPPGSLDPGEHMLLATPAANAAMWVLALVIVVLSWTPPADRHFRRARRP